MFADQLLSLSLSDKTDFLRSSVFDAGNLEKGAGNGVKEGFGGL